MRAFPLSITPRVSHSLTRCLVGVSQWLGFGFPACVRRTRGRFSSLTHEGFHTHPPVDWSGTCTNTAMGGLWVSGATPPATASRRRETKKPSPSPVAAQQHQQRQEQRQQQQQGPQMCWCCRRGEWNSIRRHGRIHATVRVKKNRDPKYSRFRPSFY